VTDRADGPLRRLGAAEESGSPGRFRAGDVITKDTILDSGLPTVVFVTAYVVTGQDLTLAIWAAVVSGAVLAVLRLARRQTLQNVLAGFLGVAVAAFFASRTGRAEDYFLPGLLINAGYAVAYVVSILVRWPLLGVLVAAVTGEGMGWRQDPVRLRAYSLASWIWVGMFVVRLAVQLPLYLAGEDGLVALGIARVAMGWPLFFLCLYLSWVVIRSAGRTGTAAVEGAGEEEPAGP
jgi:hypothetical protein